MHLKLHQNTTTSSEKNKSAAVQIGLAVADLFIDQGYPLWLNLQQVGEIVGIKDPKTIRKYCRAGVLPSPDAVTKRFHLIEVVMAGLKRDGARHVYSLSAKDQAEVSEELKSIREIYQIGR